MFGEDTEALTRDFAHPELTIRNFGLDFKINIL